MRILMIVPYYAPDLGPSAPLFTMLSVGLVRRGHKVTAIAAVPHYPTGQVPVDYRKSRIQRSIEDGVEVARIPIPSVDRSNLSKRLFQYICYQVGATWDGLHRQYDVVFCANPALWVWLPFASLAVFRRKSAIFSVHDVYPDVGVTLGVFHHKALIKAVAGLERYCLKHAEMVRILSESFRPGLRVLGVPDSKMVLIYDWVDTDLIRPMSCNNAFALEHNLTGQFNVLYAGNLGLSQGLENVLTAAEQLSAYQDIKFVFVGDGSGREQLVIEAEKRQLANVRFMPFQPRSRLPEVLATADVSLVILRRGIGSGSLPSKVFSILASGRPILASVDEACETWDLVERAQAGLCVPPENPSELAEAILALRRDQGLRERLGRNGRSWAELYHSPQSAAEQFEKLLLEVVSPQRHNSLVNILPGRHV
jgi:putative colanic acid biosynthesis glycosyltransferase WcaI